ncbi:MAG: metal-dependent phosphohydrolase [Intrasporangium sp.]|uniref:HD-GYP domain-containing protein n=1 Tax=Intrasporangium sp. TaxID=1925024 RepID=UPI00264737DA|nr:HD domain-containing phosphohydrolase [Intrasporangium sp.]MDN5796112.1 metal-dependent phosphohydrolase [Intrasporangium sp.]
MVARRVPAPSTLNGLLAYVLAVTLGALALGVALLVVDGPPPWAQTALFVVMGLVSFNLRVPDVGARSAISFLSVVLLASGVIVGPFGAWLVGATAVLSAVRRTPHWYQWLYNMAMIAIIATLAGLSYRLAGGAVEVAPLSGAAEIGLHVGGPLLVADVVLCVSNAVLLAAVMRIDQGHPFVHMVRQMLATTGPSYVGYGIIGFLFVVLWYPAGLGPVSALYIFAPLLVARWAFIQYVDESRSHQRTVDALVTALGTKRPLEVAQCRRTALLAEWIAEDLGLPAQQVSTAQHVALLHRLGDLGLESAVERAGRGSSLTGDVAADPGRARARLARRMVEGIEFLEPAGPGIEHQDDAYDGSTGSLAGSEIPVSARIVAVAASFEALTRELADTREALARIEAESGRRFDPTVVAALGAALQRHPWPPAQDAAGQEVPA